MSKKISRRRFLQISGLAAGATMLPLPIRWLGPGNAEAFYQSSGIPLFKTPLRIAQLPICASDGKAPVTGVKHYTIDIKEFQDQLIPTGYGYNKTTLWGYDPSKTVQQALGLPKPPATHLGGLILANRGEPIQITFKNKLNKTYNGLAFSKHILPADTSFFPDAATLPNKTATHLHGGYIPWISDGGPYDWFDAYGNRGFSFLNNQVLNPGAGVADAEYYYGNDQSARMLWYHDHAHDITRINAYAGLASAYLLRDNFEAGLIASAGLPPYVESSVTAGKEIQELPLVFQDKIFVGTNISLLDPSWKSIVAPSAQGAGSLWYPHIYEASRWRKIYSAKTLPAISCIPEMFGDTMLVNGTVYPEVQIEPRRYRLRLLNACNARVLNLQLYVDDGSPDGITLGATGNPTNPAFVNAATNNTSFLQIATEGGFQPRTVEVPSNVPLTLNPLINPLNPVAQGSLIVGNAERYDLIVDFSNYAGQKIVLYNDAPAPFPGGDPRNDYFPKLANGNPVNAGTAPGKGPNTRVLMRFNVSKPLSSTDAPLGLAAGTNIEAMPAVGGHSWNDPLPVPTLPSGLPDLTQIPAGVRVRRLSLNEVFDAWGRLMQLIGTDTMQPTATYGLQYADPATEIISLNGGKVTEIWQIANLTADVHPIHFHLVNVQILKRCPVNVANPFSAGTGLDAFNFTGPERLPDLNEIGLKETCRMNPGEVITVIMEFSLPPIRKADGTIIPTPLSPRLKSAYNIDGHEYVWHCHILEHEEHDMMRPLAVIA